MPRLLVWILMFAGLACTSGCVRTREVRVSVPVVVTPPPCVRLPPPVPGETMTAAEQVDYEVELTVWAWSAWRACKPEGAKP
jgi:hypothetical protein